MPDRIPVHDDWGNQVGEFIPSGSGAGGLIVLFLGLLIIGLPFYIVYRLIADGIEAAKDGKWSKAVLVLSALTISVFLVLALIIQTTSYWSNYYKELDDSWLSSMMKIRYVSYQKINSGKWLVLMSFETQEWSVRILPVKGECNNGNPIILPIYGKAKYECIFDQDVHYQVPSFSVTVISRRDGSDSTSGIVKAIN